MNKKENNNWFTEYNQKALRRYESIFKYLKVDFDDSRNDIIEIVCPIHESDDMGHSIIYRNTGVWLCFSGNCHMDHGKTILGLIKGVLSKNIDNPSWNDVKNVVDGEHAEVEIKPISPQDLTKDMFKDESSKPQYSTPSLYFMKRGFRAETLNYFDVGDCHKSPYDNRAIVPIHYINGEYMGFSSRIHFPECKKCGYYHSVYSTCISKDHDFHFMYHKWYHSKGLQKSQTLYGINKIGNTNKVAIVEGPGCVWKLHEFGIPAMACLGKDFSDIRLNLLKKLNIEKVLFIPDNDSAGEEFKKRFITDYHTELDIYLPNLTKKDVGEMSDEEIEKIILNKWEKI